MLRFLPPILALAALAGCAATSEPTQAQRAEADAARAQAIAAECALYDNLPDANRPPNCPPPVPTNPAGAAAE